jgi:hypothetical protein
MTIYSFGSRRAAGGGGPAGGAIYRFQPGGCVGLAT